MKERGRTQSKRLLSLRKKYVPNCFAHVTEVVAGKARGNWIEDVDGNKYLDFGAGISVVNAGNCHPDIVQAVKTQAELSFHTCFHIVMQENYIKLAERLAKMTPGTFPKKAMFLNSGAEAIENVIKLARIFTKRLGFMAPEHGFHGRTYGALALTSKTKPLKAGMGPFMQEVYRIPYAYCYRCAFQLTYPECSMECVQYIENMFTTTVPAESVAGIIIEPVLGEGGVVIPPKEYLEGLRKICDKYGILLIFDEIQTAFGRIGALFAADYFKVVPDIMSLAKALANGLPISAVVGKSEIMDRPNVGALGSTFGGNPIICAASHAMLDVLKNEKLPQRAKRLGAKMMKRLKLLEKTYEFIGDVRGIGMIKRGLIVIRAGAHSNIIRILPPLNSPENDIEKGMEIIESVFNDINPI